MNEGPEVQVLPELGRGTEANGVARTLAVDGLQRRYRLVTPGGSAPGAGRPLLLVYHGSGGYAEEHISNTDFPTFATNAGMLVAYNGRCQRHGRPMDLRIPTVSMSPTM